LVEANGPNGGDMTPRKNKKKKKKKDCHLDDIIESMTQDLMQVSGLNHRRGVFLQRAATCVLERPDEYVQRRERENQTIASCQALLRRAKEAAAARAKLQAKTGGNSSSGGDGGGGGTGSDDLALPW
jgi:hypothetical protein